MLELRGVSKRYGDKTALEDVSFQLENGIYALLGPNGAGKSTLMNMITGSIQPSWGTIRWNGTDIDKLGASYRSILGYAPQQQGLYDAFTGRRFLSYMAALKGIPGKKMAAVIDNVLEYVNLRDVADRRIGTYSGGMKQRILIAQAIMGNPELIILDEPTVGLDPKERIALRERICQLADGRIILVSTHVVSDIESIADEVIVLKSGRMTNRDSVDNLCAQHGNAADLEEVYMHIFGEDERNDAACNI